MVVWGINLFILRPCFGVADTIIITRENVKKKKKMYVANEEQLVFRDKFYYKLSIFLAKRNVCKY